jgi:hypothetical protein
LLGLAVCGVCLACLTVVSKLYRYLGNSSHAGAVWQVGVSWGRLGGHHQRGRFHRMGFRARRHYRRESLWCACFLPPLPYL